MRFHAESNEELRVRQRHGDLVNCANRSCDVRGKVRVLGEFCASCRRQQQQFIASRRSNGRERASV